MKWVKGVVLVTGLAIGGALAGCMPEQLEDGYQVGDGISIVGDAAAKAKTMRDAYCENGNKAAKGLLLTVVKAYMPMYPADGICTDNAFLRKLGDAVAERRAEGPD